MYNNFNVPQMQMQMQAPMPYMNMNMPLQHYEVIKVNGEASAKSFRMAPNSTVLLLDETAPIVWYAQTDGTGYLTATPFDITPHQAQPPVDINNLSARVAKIEEYINNVQQSNFGSTKPTKKQRQSAANADVNAESSSSNAT